MFKVSSLRVYVVPLLVCMMALAMVLPAYADIVTNTIDNTISNDTGANLEVQTISSGGSATVGFQILATKDIPVGDPNGCNVGDGAAGTVNFTVPAGVTASATSLTFTQCGVTQNITFSSSTPNPSGYVISVSSVSGGKTNQGQSLWQVDAASFKLIVNGKNNQTITFGALGNKTYGDADFGVSATATSNLPVSFAAAGNCSVSGSTVHITGAGSCTITASQAGDGSFNAAPDVPQTFSIAKANATVVVNGYSGTYDGAPHGATGSATGVGGVDLSTGLNLGATFTDVPGGTANWTFAGGADYNDQAGSVAIVINKADATVTVNGYSGTYDGNPHGASGSATGVGGADLSAGLNLGESFANVPGGTANWTFTGGANYNDQAGSVAIEIGKANATIVVTPYNVNYDGNPHTATGTATGVGGVDLSAGLTLVGTTHTNAGSYPNDPWTFIDSTGNYNNASGTVANVINKADANVSVSGYSGVYDGLAHGATGSATGVGGVDLSTGLNLGATFTDVPGGTAEWTFAGGANYNDQAGSVAIVINKADATVTVNGYTGTYDGAPHGASGSATGVGGADLSAGLNLGATFTDVPGGTANWSFTGGTNYNDANGSVAIVINKADATVTVNGYTGTYDGNPHGASGSATGVGNADLSAGLNLGESFTNVPGGTANWTFTGGTNYNDQAGSVAIEISKANATIVVTPYNVNYDGNPHTATGTATGVLGESLSGLNLANTTHTDPGSYPNDPWTFTDSTGNYNNASGTVANIIKSWWTLKGFYQPTDMNGVVNTVKNGSTVPLKFEIFAGTTELTDPGAVKTLNAIETKCSGGSEDAIELTATGGTSLRYDATSGQFIYNWQTPKKAGFCYVVTLTAKDGTSISANFKLK